MSVKAIACSCVPTGGRRFFISRFLFLFVIGSVNHFKKSPDKMRGSAAQSPVVLCFNDWTFCG
jgi:hypothetical protein